MKNTKQWWGYVHSTGSIQAKPYFRPLDIEEAEESPFCVAVFGPFEASSREDAITIISNLFSKIAK